MGYGLIGQISNNPDITKGGQKVLVSDIHRIELHVYRKKYKFHVNLHGWNVLGNIEVKQIMEAMKLMVEGEYRTREKYSVNTHTQNGKITSVGVR